MLELPLYEKVPRLAIEDAQPLQPDPGCKRCPLSSGVKTVCMAPELGAPGGLLVVGKGPGEVEDKAGKPEQGESGTYLRQQIARFWKGPVSHHNALACMPGARTGLGEAVSACRSFVASAFFASRPERVLCLGYEAFQSVLGFGAPPYSVRRGYAYTSTGIPVYLLVHPAAGLRNRFVRGWFEEDLRWALSPELPEKPPTGAKVHVVETLGDAVEAVRELTLASGLTIDCETFGAVGDHDHEVLTCAVVPYGSDDAYVWDRGLSQVFVDGDAAFLDLLRQLVPLIGRRSLSKCGANLKFDAEALSFYLGCEFNGMGSDVQLWRRMLDSDAETALETLQHLVGMGGAKHESEAALEAAKAFVAKCLKRKGDLLGGFDLGTFQERRLLEAALRRVGAGAPVERYAYAGIPAKVRAIRCAGDAVSTERLRRLGEAELGRRPLLKKAWEGWGVGQMRAVAAMEQNGVKASLPAIRQLQAAMQAQIDDTRQKLAAYGKVDLGLNGMTQDVARFLYEELKLPVGRKTSKGPALDDETLKGLAHPAADLIRKYREGYNFKSRNADGMEAHIRDDGRIHCSIRIDGTSTSRPSGTEPNLLNLPRVNPQDPFRIGKMCRDIIVAEDGWILLEGDLSQIQLRIAAHLSQDLVMTQMFVEGVDFHLGTARLIAPIFGLDPASITKEHSLRDRAKTAVFASLFDPWDFYALAQQLGVPVSQAKTLREAMYGKFRCLSAWFDAMRDQACRTGITPLCWVDGQPARFRNLIGILGPEEQRKKTDERSSCNSPIQGEEARLASLALGRVQAWLDEDRPPARLLLTVYDSILMECREDAVEEVGFQLWRIMQMEQLGAVPVVADLKKGYAWGSMEGFKVV